MMALLIVLALVFAFICACVMNYLCDKYYWDDVLVPISFLIPIIPIGIYMVFGAHWLITSKKRKEKKLETEYQECLRLIEYKPKPDNYWRIKELEWELQETI